MSLVEEAARTIQRHWLEKHYHLDYDYTEDYIIWCQSQVRMKQQQYKYHRYMFFINQVIKIQTTTRGWLSRRTPTIHTFVLPKIGDVSLDEKSPKAKTSSTLANTKLSVIL